MEVIELVGFVLSIVAVFLEVSCFRDPYFGGFFVFVGCPSQNSSEPSS